jgi:hypothetical protein
MEEHGIYVSNSGDRPVVRGNRLHDNAGAGVQLNADLSAGGDGIITDALIENNVIYGNGSAGGAAINLDGVQDSVVRNNLLYDNHATGIVNYIKARPGECRSTTTPDMAQALGHPVQPDHRSPHRANILYNRSPTSGGFSTSTRVSRTWTTTTMVDSFSDGETTVTPGRVAAGLQPS